jgi:hypothetical protein
LDLQVLVAQLQFHEQLVVRLELLQLVQVVQLARQVLRQLVLQLVQAQLLVVAPLELVEHPYLQKKIGVPKMLKLLENLAYLF